MFYYVLSLCNEGLMPIGNLKSWHENSDLYTLKTTYQISIS